MGKAARNRTIRLYADNKGEARQARRSSWRSVFPRTKYRIFSPGIVAMPFSLSPEEWARRVRAQKEHRAVNR